MILVVFRSVARHTDVIIFHIIATLMTLILILEPLDGFFTLAAIVAAAFPISVAVGLVVATIFLVVVGPPLTRFMILFLGCWLLILLQGRWLEHRRAHSENRHLMLDLLHNLLLMLLHVLELLESCLHLFRLGGIFLHNVVCKFFGLHGRCKVGQDLLKRLGGGGVINDFAHGI